MSFEDFLTQQKNPQTTDALTPPSTPGLGAAPDQFEAFLRKAQGANSEATVQSAQAATVANASQSADLAAQAAPVSRKLGVPQAAIETDLPRFQQQVKMQDNAAFLAQNPVLAKWVAANPDSARIAQDEYDKMSAAEKLWTGTKDTGYAALQGLATPWNKLAFTLNLAGGTVPMLYDALVGGDKAQTWWFRNTVAQNDEANKVFTLKPTAGIHEKAAQTAGNLLSSMSQMVLAGPEAEALPVTAGAAETAAHATQNAVGQMAFPSLAAATDTAHQVLQSGGTGMQATNAAVGAYLTNTLQGMVPLSAPGGLPTRLVTGFGSGVASGEAQRQAMNLLLPENMKQEFNAQELIFSGLTGAVMGGALGPHKQDPLVLDAVRRTYAEAADAARTERDINKVVQLGQLAAESKLREADPEAYKRFVETVTDKSDLDAVYVNAKDLNNAFAQSGFDASTVPDLARKTAEATLTGGDVRIPVSDYAAHIAGTDLEKAILPSMKASPEGMTYKEGQDYYAKAVETMKSRADEVLAQRQEHAELAADQDKVYQNVLDQLTATGRNPDAVNKAYASLVSEFYATQAQREGVKPSELFAKHPLRIGAEALTGGLKQSERPEASLGATVLELGKHESLFQYPKSSAKTLEGIAADKHPNLKVTEETITQMDGKEKPTGNWDIVMPDGNGTVMMTRKGDKVWINAAGLKSGSAGSLAYDLVANYAHNNGLKFVGDPAGVSKAAMLRRAENMLSSAIKYGTTEHLEPHPDQVKGNDTIPGIPWHEGDTEGNIRALMHATMEANSKLSPLSEAISYDAEHGTFVDSAGNHVSGTDVFSAISDLDRGTSGAGAPGEATLRRNALFHSLLQGEGTRRAVLDELRRLASGGSEGDGGALGKSFYQDVAGERGSYQPATSTISLLKNADLSTFLHESGHFFLDTLSKLASRPDAPSGAKEDFGTLLKWFGVKDAETWNAMTLDQQRAAHEKFAKSFEQYLFEGKSPNVKLQPLFSRFRSWLINVYRNIAGIGADMTPEVRGVMDRLLASDDAIREAEQVRSYKPLFENAKAAGMSIEDFNAYLDQGKQATDNAVSEMQAKSMKDMQWLSNAKSKALKGLQRQADAARKEVRAQVENEVSEMPVFKTQDYLNSHKNYDPEIVANMNGYEDAHHMEQAIAQAGNKKDMIEALTDQRMLQQHGELVDPQSVETAANEAVHNEARARFMATGLKALTDSPLPANQIAKAAKEAAEAAIASKPVGELRPDQYLAAEARANKEAIAAAAKDPAAAIEAQRAAILNNRLAKAAMDAQAEVQKGLDYLRKFDKPTVTKAIGGEYMDRINELLSQFDVTNRFNTKSDVQARQQFRDWLGSEFDKTGVMPEVSDALLNWTQKRHWKELSVEDFRGLVDATKSLEHVGREQMLITVAGQKVALQEKVDQAKADMASLPHSEPIDVQPHLKHAEGLDKISAQFLAAKSKIRGIDAALVKMEQLFQWLTYGTKAGLGETRSGPFLEMFQRAGDAEGAERQMRAESANDMRALGDSLRDSKVNLNESLNLPLKRPGRGGQWYREELIAAALNTGNEGNLKKLIEGYKKTDPAWSRESLMAVLDQHLSAPEWKFVQGVWDAIGKYGQQISDLQKRQTGVAPKMVEAQTVTTQHGEFKGGYYPVVYDAFLDHNIETKNLKNADALFENQFARPSTSKGHTVERTDYVGPIQLNLGVISRHLDQVTHDLAWREAIVDINKFLSHPEIRSEVDQTMGKEYTKQFRPWLQAMANDKVFNTAGDSAWESFYRKVRSNATMVGLGFRLSTMMIHGSSAMSNSIGEVGVKWFAKGAAEFARDWEGTKAFMYERSPEMANRFNESDRNIHEAIDQINEHQKSLGPISATQKAVDGARKFAFYGVSALDMGSAAPTWMAAYMKGMEHEAKGGLGMSEDAAIDYANRAVRNAHGGGGAKDLSAVQRDKGAMSLATMFYSFWNHMYNRQRDLAKGFGNLPESFKQGTGTRDFAKLLARSWWYFVIPQVIHALMKPTPANEQEGGEDDLGAMAAHMGKEIGLGFVSGVPVLRDLANAAINGRDYTITPLEQAGKSIVKAAVDTTHFVKGEEMSPHAGKNFAQAAGYTLGLPTGQLSGTGSFLWDVYSGDADPQGIKDWYTGIQNGRISP